VKNQLSTIAFASLVLVFTLPVLAQNDAKRSVTEIGENIYRLQNNFHYSMAVITSEGAVVVDPINADAAKWIKSEVAKLTDKPVTHLIYSHSHGDHASGGEVLAEGATVIAQSNAPEHIDGVKPGVRFDESHEFSLGDKTFELTWLGPGHGKDLITVIVRPDNVAFVPDAASPKRLPYQDMRGSNVDDWIAQVKKLESLDFEVFAPAHGNIGVKADATDVRVYMEDLRSAVLEGLRAGKSIEELKSSVTMDSYKDWGQYERWLALNVQGMASFLIRSGQAN